MSANLIYQLALSQIPGIGPILAKNLVGYCGGVEAVFAEKLSSLKKIPGVGEKIAHDVFYFEDFDSLNKEVEFIQKSNILTYFFTDKSYPYRLKQIHNSPILLFKKGEVDLNNPKLLAIIGTRKCSKYGREKTNQIIEELSHYNPTIVSGLAHGIDSFAHKAAVNSNLKTISVLGHGFDRIYPAINKNLAIKILENNGCWLSEFKSGTKPDRENFPKRNRIVAGMVDAILVIETPTKGGSMITANLGFDYNRDVYALPGRAGDLLSSGCNELIKRQKAHLVESAKDIVELLNWDLVETKKQSQISLPLSLTSDEQVIFEALRENGIVGIDTLSEKVNIGVSKLAFSLLEMEFKNLVRSLPGKQYELK